MMIKVRSSPLTLKLNCLTKPKSKKKVSKLLKIEFAVVLAFLSLDFGFIRFKCPRICVLVKSICAFQTLVITLVFTYFYTLGLKDLGFQFWYSMYLFKYIVIVFVLLFTKKYNFYEFCSDLWSIDVELGIIASSKLEYVILIGIGSCLLFRSSFSIIYCTSLINYCIRDVKMLIIFYIPLLCVDTFLLVYFVIYYCLYDRLKAFTRLVADGYTDVVVSQFLYKSIVDTADNIKKVYNSLYVVPLCCNTLDIMISIFYPLIQMDKQDGSIKVTMANASVLQVFVQLFLPAFAAGLLSSQVDQLKVVLHDRLLQERDQSHTKDIERFLGYIEVRHLKTTIWKVIPLDWRLPVIFVNLSVTYLIVMLQFTHKY